ncbi:MAG: hypothetical protein K1X72_00090 [Pyrinomonadaceae bacterium]|nr:hypothetical protein [Pyrinomonadaceae bacterium]
MNIFEDLIEELKEENLIEQTVIETANSVSIGRLDNNNSNQLQPKPIPANQVPPPNNSVFNPNSLLQELKTTDESVKPSQAFIKPVEDKKSAEEEEANLKELFAELEALEKDSAKRTFASMESLNPAEQVIPPTTEEFNEEDYAIIEDNNPNFQVPINVSKPAVSEKEFYRRRATEEVNSLQIVEHILSAIEREQMKIVPKPYDDISVKMALHDFLKITEEAQTNEHTQAEFKLMQETESWYSALAHRDKHISIGDLRRYCENTRPTLSLQALAALARFYRNSPFTEAVRNKFDVVVTRLLTKEIFPDRREILFDREELIKHLTDLYADWSSIPLYETENDSDVLLATLKIEDFINEVVNANSFEDLISKDFFNRLRLFKESVGEKFFSPLLTATSIECNVIVGNKYVDLLDKERAMNNAKSIEEKYQFFLDQTVSDATSKTLQLVEVLKEKKGEGAGISSKTAETLAEREVLKLDKPLEKYRKINQNKTKSPFFGINKWLFAAAILTVIFAVSLVVYVEIFTEPIKTSSSVIKVNLEESSLQEYFKTARINRGTFYAITKPEWDSLSKDVKEDILKKTLAVGSEQGYFKIHLMDSEGKTMAFASQSGIDLNPQN